MDQQFLQLIVVFQYYAGRNSAGAGAHVVHSNCACTRSVNINKLTVDCYIECTHYSCCISKSNKLLVNVPKQEYMCMSSAHAVGATGVSFPSLVQKRVSGSHSMVQHTKTTVL